MAIWKLSRGNQEQYDALASKDENTVYFCKDSGNIYLGALAMFDGETFKSVAVKKVEGELDGKKLEFTKKDGSKFTLDVEEIINGGVIKLTGYEKPELTTRIYATDTVNAALGKLEKKVDDAVAGGVQSIGAGSGIAVDAADENNPVVSVKIKDGDALLSADTNGLASTISLSYDSANRKIQLFGKDTDNPISEIDAEAFIKDGVLYDQIIATPEGTSLEVTFPKDSDVHTFTGLTAGHPYLFLEFNDNLGKTTSKSFASCDMHGLVDVYTAGNGLQLGTGVDDHKFSIKLDSSNANGLSVGEAGLALAKASASADGALSKEDYAKIQSAVQGVSAEGDTDYVTASADVEDNEVTVSVEAKIQAISTAGSTHKGLAAAEDVASMLTWGEF